MTFSTAELALVSRLVDTLSIAVGLSQDLSNRTNDRFDHIDSALTILLQQVTGMAHTIQEVSQNLDDTKELVGQILELIHSHDAENEALKQQIVDLVAAANMAQAEKDALQLDIEAAWQKSEDTENAARAGIPGVPPVGGEPLGVTFADLSAFNSAVAAYTGPEAVTLDGTEMKSGTMPSLDYFSHSEDGHVDISGPTT
jgi:hypothetical protein